MSASLLNRLESLAQWRARVDAAAVELGRWLTEHELVGDAERSQIAAQEIGELASNSVKTAEEAGELLGAKQSGVPLVAGTAGVVAAVIALTLLWRLFSRGGGDSATRLTPARAS